VPGLWHGVESQYANLFSTFVSNGATNVPIIEGSAARFTYWVQDGIYPVMKEAIAYSNKDVPREVNNGKNSMHVFSQLKRTKWQKHLIMKSRNETGERTQP
jgi:uncharacterized ion transporter superfamily protein YfcC